MQVGARIPLGEALSRARESGASAAPRDAAAIFLAVLQLAADQQATIDAMRVLVGEDGSLGLAPDALPDVLAVSDAEASAARVRGAAATGNAIYSALAAGAPPPLHFLGGATDGSAVARFPTLRHLLDAFELQLLFAASQGEPPRPQPSECRAALARLYAGAHVEREAPPAIAPAEAPTEPPAIALAKALTEPPAIAQAKGLTEPPAIALAKALTEPPAIAQAKAPTEPPAIAQAEALTEPPAIDPAVALTEPPAIDPAVAPTQPRAIEPAELPTDPPEPGGPLHPGAPRRWMRSAIAGAALVVAIAIACIGLLLRSASRGSSAGPRAAATAIAAPPLEPLLAPRPSAALPPASAAPPPIEELNEAPLRDAMEGSSEGAERRARVNAEIERGRDALEAGRPFEALVAFRNALRIQPRRAAALRGLGDAYRLQGDRALAIEAYESFLRTRRRGSQAETVRSLIEELRASE